MVTLFTPSYLDPPVDVLVDDEDLTFLGETLSIAFLRTANDVTFITREDGARMATNQRYTRPWHTGETATAFSCTVRHQDGTLRTDIDSATFTLTNRANNAKLIDAADCQTAADGVVAYLPDANQMTTACLFLAQFTVTLASGYVLPTMLIEGEIEASL